MAGPRAVRRSGRLRRVFAGGALVAGSMLGAAALAQGTNAGTMQASPPGRTSSGAPGPGGTAPVTVELPLERLSASAWYVRGQLGTVSTANQGFNSNAGFVVTPEGVVVFDALGTPPLGHALLARIRTVSDAPVRTVIVSHYHADHFYGLPAFKQAGAQVWAHRSVRDYLAGDAAERRLAERRESLAPWVDAQAGIVRPDRELDAATSFQLGGLSFDVLHVGFAHTGEDLMLYLREEGVLFAGDLMFVGRIPFVGDGDLDGWLRGIERLLALAPRIVVGGHGPASRDAVRDLAMTRDYLLHLRATMGRAVDDGVDFDQAYRDADWSRYRALPAFDAANRANAYRAYLLMEREALAAARK
jgi:glyoxylase-like metal-dependent hydrolase (beta-lactamase superfamily II)